MKTIQVPLSKSMVNRNLILQSFSGSLPNQPPTEAEDVVDLHQALAALEKGETSFTIRNGGTSLRFLIARLSRIPGQYQVKASERLASRPIEELVRTLDSLGVKVSRDENVFSIQSDGWKSPTTPITLDCERSTQFASAVLLASAGLDFDIEYNVENLEGSRPYFEMTIETLRSAGLDVSFAEDQVKFAKDSVCSQKAENEIDLSSAFSIVACLTQKTDLQIKDYPARSLQADSVFPKILSEMGIQSDNGRFFKPNLQIKPVNVDLEDSPDLLPVLAALCALSSEKSTLSGLKNLVYKESNRIEKSVELLTKAGATAINRDGESLEIQGPVKTEAVFDFDPDHDHRMAMAAAVLKTAGSKIKILHPEVVDKSLPGFFDIVEVEL